MYSGEGDDAHAVEHNKCTRGDAWLWGGCSVGVQQGQHQACARELRGGQWQYREGGGGGMERMGRRGQADSEGGWHISVLT